MTKYAQYNPALNPAPICGWYDTDDYPTTVLPPTDSILELTAEQWTAHMTSPYAGYAVQDNALVPYVPPAPALSPAQQAVVALNAGVTLTSAAAPALNGTYACDPTAQNKIMATDLFITKNGTFFGGATSYPWLDIAGTAHVFPDVATFEAFATAVANYVALLDAVIAGQSTTIPSSTITIP